MKQWALDSIRCMLCILASLQIYAQPRSIFFDHLDIHNGLSNDQVVSVCKDKMGFLWISTLDGLNRYDGKGFQKIYSYEGDSNSLWNDYLSKLNRDETGDIWVNSYKGTCYINPQTLKIKRVYCTDKPKGGNGFTVVMQNPFSKQYWGGSQYGVYTIDKKNGIATPFTDKDSLLRKSTITCFLFQTPENIWIGTYNGLVHYNSITNQCIQYTPAGKPASAEYNSYTIVTSLFSEPSGKLWAGTWGHGVQSFDPATKKFTMFLPQPQLGVRGDANIITQVMPAEMPGQEGLLWLNGEAPGFLMFNTRTGTFSCYSSLDKTSKSTSYTRGTCLYYTPEDGLWIGSFNGLYRYDPMLQTFETHSITKPANTHCLGDINCIYADYEDATGNTVYVVTWTCGIFKYNLQTGEQTPVLRWLTKQHPDNYIYTLVRDKNKKLWIGSGNETLMQVNERANTVVKHRYYDSTLRQYTNLYASAILEDTLRHCLWLGTNSGLFKLSLHDNTIQKIVASGIKDGIAYSGNVYGICFDGTGHLWIGTLFHNAAKAALARINPDNFSNDIYISGAGSLPAADVFNSPAYNPVNKTMWCVTEKGLLYWNTDKTPSFNFLTRKDGIGSDHLYGVVPDKYGTVWVSSQSGVSAYDPATKTFSNFNASHGLATNQSGSISQNHITGNLIIGYNAVLHVVNSEIPRRHISAPPVYITSFKIANKLYSSNNSYAFPDKQQLSLTHKQNNITIEFAALSYTIPEATRYAYKIDGTDDDWNYITGNTVTYSQLPSGQYTFRVKACNSTGTWNDTDTWITFSIALPFYKTWWFISLCILAIAAILYSIYRYRIAQLRKMHQIRNDIARDLHDEVGSTLTSIHILSKVSKANLHKDTDNAEQYINRITEQSQEIQQNMSDIVWAIKPGDDKIENIVIRMREYLAHTLETTNIRVRFNVADALVKENLGMQQRRDFFLIFKEAVNNAAKYADATEVVIDLQKHKNKLLLHISDNGKGFDTATARKSNGLKNMKTRAEGLNGYFTIESEPGKGTSVKIEIPIH